VRVVLFCCCGHGGRWRGVFISGFVGGNRTRLVSGCACLVEAARPPWNKFLQVFVHLVVMSSGGGGGLVGLLRLRSEDPLRASDGTSSGLFLWVVVGAVIAGVGVVLWSSGMAVVGGVGAGAKEPTAVVTYRGFLAAYQRLGSALWFGLAMRGGVKSRGLARWPAISWCRQDLGKKKNSSGQDFVVISMLLGDLSARKDCTVPLL